MVDPTGQAPFGLKPQTTPRVRAEAGQIVVRIELVSLRDRLDVLDLEIVLSSDYGAQLGLSLLDAAKKLA
jgi:hypothetical protein